MKTPAHKIAVVALGTALITVSAWLSLPVEVPFTMQTFAVCLVAALLGPRLGCLIVGVYLALGTAGAPVFSGFRGGPAVLLGVTGGYLVGFLFTALAAGWGAARLGRRLPVLLFSMALGLLLCYAFGTAWFVLVYTGRVGAISIGAALLKCVVPYLLPDGIKIVLAALLTARLYPIIHKEGSL